MRRAVIFERGVRPRNADGLGRNGELNGGVLCELIVALFERRNGRRIRARVRLFARHGESEAVAAHKTGSCGSGDLRQAVIDELGVCPRNADGLGSNGEVNGARYFCCIIIARIVGQSDDCDIIARGDRICLLSALGEGDISGHVAFLQRRARPRQSHLARLARSVIGKIGIDRQPALQYHLLNGKLFNIDHAVKLVIARIVAFQFGGGGILAGVDRLSVRGVIALDRISDSHIIAVKHALESEAGHGGVAAVLQFVKTAPSSCGEGERGDRIGKVVVLITYGVSALALYGHGVSARVKSVHAVEHRRAVLIRNGNGEVVGRKRAALSSAHNGEVTFGDKPVRTRN